MYTARVNIDNLEETAVYPMVLGVIADLKHKLHIPSTIPVRVGGNPPLYISRDGTQNMEHIPDILNEELLVEYREVNTDDMQMALSRSVPTGMVLHLDNSIHTKIAPVIRRKTLTISLTYSCKSKTLATRFINNIASYGSRDTNSMYHDLEYFYYVPDVIIEIVDVFNNLKNTYATTKTILEDYITATFNNQACMINSESGNDYKRKLAVREKQDTVIGTITTSNFDITKDKDSDTNRWSVELEYVIEYDLPEQLVVMYPILIHNQPMPTKYRLDPTKLHTKTKNRTIGEGKLASLAERIPEVLRIPRNSYYLHIPNQDMLILPPPAKRVVRLFSAIAVLDPLDLTKLFYLDELPGITIHPAVVDLMILEASYVGTILQSLFYLELYDNDAKMYSHKIIPKIVTTVVNGVSTTRVLLTTDKPLLISNLVRVCFNILTDLSALPTAFVDRIKANAAKANTMHPPGSDVIGTIYSVLSIDVNMLNRDFVVTPNTQSIDVALNIKAGISTSIYSKQRAMVVTEILKPK